MGSGSASDDRPIIEENQGKALLIYNIAKFTVWPSETEPSEAPFVFASWNDKALTKAFEVIEGQKIQSRTVSIKFYKKNNNPMDCEVLFIPQDRLQAFTRMRDEINTKPILTVTTDPGVFDAGAMVLIEIVDDHLSFSVNLGRVKATGLEISGNLLRHAKEVNF